MNVAGFRAGADSIDFAVVDRNAEGHQYVVADGTWTAPMSYEEPAILSWMRDKVLGLVAQHGFKRAGVRFPETSARVRHKLSANCRSRIEGVIIEALNSQGVVVLSGALQSIATRIGTASTKTAKAYLARQEFRGLDLSKKSNERQEAILVACSAEERANGH